MRSVYVLAASFVFAACTDGSPDNLSTGEHGIVVNNRISSNRISSNRISSNRISSNRISSNRISSNRLTANEAALGDLLSTDEGVELFSFIISCALPEGQTLIANDPQSPGNTIEFSGEVGLAPDWEDHPMTLRDQRWVSSCMFARVNETNQIVSISMRGPSFALDSTAAEKSQYTLQEGGFYGNMFLPLDQPLDWNACRGRDKAGAAPEAGGLVNRHCAEEDPAHPGFTRCGFNYAGDCADFAAPKNNYACAAQVFGPSGFYIACRDDADFGGFKGGHGHGWGHGGRRSHGHDGDDNDDDESHHDDGDCDHDDDNGHNNGGHGNHGNGGFGNTYHQVVTTYTQP